jgi:hypothetical protein
MKYKFLVALLGLSLPANAEEELIDLSGSYVENGMPVRVSGGVPKLNVSLCGLLSGDLDSSLHGMLARPDRRIKIVQEGELVLEIYISGGLPGTSVFTTTNADGLKVDATGLTFSRKIQETGDKSAFITCTYRLELDQQGSLIVDIDFVFSRPGRLGRKVSAHEAARYAFPRFAGSDSSEKKK